MPVRLRAGPAAVQRAEASAALLLRRATESMVREPRAVRPWERHRWVDRAWVRRASLLLELTPRQDGCRRKRRLALLRAQLLHN